MKRQKVFAGLFLGLGVFLVLVSAVLSFVFPPQLSFEELPLSELAAVEVSAPEQIKIDSVGIDLRVRPAGVEDNNWPLFEDAASWLVASGGVGQPGNLVIYAHNKNHLFGPLRMIEPGDWIEIKDDQGQNWHYQIEKTLTVSPDAVGVLAPTDTASLTLYTCAGFLDQKRFIVKARLKEVGSLDAELKPKL